VLLISATLIVIPIFALIFAGWGAGRTGLFGVNASAEINKFVVWLAVPALLFEIISTSNVSELWQPGFIGAFALSAVITLVVAIIMRLRTRGNLADAAIDGLNAAYSNIGFVGFPLLLVVLGETSLVFVTIALMITMCVIFATVIVLVEIALHARGGVVKIIIKVAGTLIQNPILVASAAALPFPLFGWTVPVPAQTFLKMLGGAASPCALVALGLFLSQPRLPIGPQRSLSAFLVTAKLVVHPLLAWFFAAHVFRLEPFQVTSAILLAALPAGTGSFMLAGFYARDASVSSFVIIASTLISVMTLALLVAVQQPVASPWP
jgi:predicted permease